MTKVEQIGYIEKGTGAHQSNKIFSDEGLAKTLSASDGIKAPAMMILSDVEIEPCDFRFDEGIRTRVDKDVSPTLVGHMSQMQNDYSCMVKETSEKKRMRIRKLTSLESWRLMGFDDDDYFRAAEVNSESQLYKQAGNSIVVDVLCAIFRQML